MRGWLHTTTKGKQMIKVVSISEAPEFEDETGWSIDTPYQVHVLDGADPQVHADARILLKRMEYKNGNRMIMVRVYDVNGKYILSTQAMDALARRVDPKARLVDNNVDMIGRALYRTYSIKD